jgi:hypothetical protein
VLSTRTAYRPKGVAKARFRRPDPEPAQHQGGQALGSRQLLKKQRRAPRVVVTDKLGSCGAAKREIMPSVEHRQHKGLNN